MAGSTAYNAFQHAKKAMMETGNPVIGMASAVGGSIKDVSQATFGHLSEHAQNLTSKSVGGPGLQQPISSISSRLYHAAKTVQARAGEKG